MSWSKSCSWPHSKAYSWWPTISYVLHLRIPSSMLQQCIIVIHKGKLDDSILRTNKRLPQWLNNIIFSHFSCYTLLIKNMSDKICNCHCWRGWIVLTVQQTPQKLRGATPTLATVWPFGLVYQGPHIRFTDCQLQVPFGSFDIINSLIARTFNYSRCSFIFKIGLAWKRLWASLLLHICHLWSTIIQVQSINEKDTMFTINKVWRFFSGWWP